MRINMAAVGMAIFAMFLSGCGSTLIAYQPSPGADVKEAAAVLVNLTKKLDDDDIVVEESHIRLGGGSRVYFEAITDVSIYKKKSWYYVYITTGEESRYAIWTKDQGEAESYVNALDTLMRANKAKTSGNGEPAKFEEVAHPVTQKTPEPQPSKK